MSTPDLLGFAMSMESSSATPADAPAVRKMSSGLEGYPSRSGAAVRTSETHSKAEEYILEMKSATCSRM